MVTIATLQTTQASADAHSRSTEQANVPDADHSDDPPREHGAHRTKRRQRDVWPAGRVTQEASVGPERSVLRARHSVVHNGIPLAQQIRDIKESRLGRVRVSARVHRRRANIFLVHPPRPVLTAVFCSLLLQGSGSDCALSGRALAGGPATAGIHLLALLSVRGVDALSNLAAVWRINTARTDDSGAF